VFQRTPNFSVPAWNGPADPERLARIAADRAAYRAEAKLSTGGVPGEPTTLSAVALPTCERRERFEEMWQRGGLVPMLGCFNDTMVNPSRQRAAAELIREKIRSIVHDPETAEMLCPKDHPFGTKRPCVDTDYYADLQPAARAPGRPAQHADRHHHRDRHRHHGRVVRVRRDRARHRLRRDDRRDRRASTSPAATAAR
jgi:hypothetical protein